MLCPIKSNSNTIELTVHTYCYCVLDLLCVITLFIFTLNTGSKTLGDLARLKG